MFRIMTMNFSNIRLNKCGGVLLPLLVLFVFYYLLRVRWINSEVEPQVDLKRLLIGSIQAAVEGGRKVSEIFNSTKLNIQSKGLTKEGANNPVTEADLQSHCVMYFSLLRSFPTIKIISEEHVKETHCIHMHNLDLDPTVLGSRLDLPEFMVPASDITVWIDPLDATQEFTEKLVEYVTTMVCVAVKGIPALGVIHFPFSKRTTWAWVGNHASGIVHLPHAAVKVITSRSHKGDVANVVMKALGNKAELVQAGGAGYKSLQVASGNVSAYVHTTIIKKWDICAGDAILRALGGSMTTLTGETIQYASDSDVVNPSGLLATMHGHVDLLKLVSAVHAS